MHLEQNLEAVRGDNFILDIVVAQEDENEVESVVDITGSKFYFTLKRSADDSDDNADLTHDWDSHTDPSNGRTQLNVDAADTNDLDGVYQYDLQYKTAGGEVVTLATGTVTFEADITRRVS